MGGCEGVVSLAWVVNVMWGAAFGFPLPKLIPYKPAFGKTQVVDKAWHGGLAMPSSV